MTTFYLLFNITTGLFYIPVSDFAGLAYLGSRLDRPVVKLDYS
jgi:hypothetical protein